MHSYISLLVYSLEQEGPDNVTFSPCYFLDLDKCYSECLRVAACFGNTSQSSANIYRQNQILRPGVIVSTQLQKK